MLIPSAFLFLLPLCLYFLVSISRHKHVTLVHIQWDMVTVLSVFTVTPTCEVYLQQLCEFAQEMLYLYWVIFQISLKRFRDNATISEYWKYLFILHVILVLQYFVMYREL